MMRQVRLLTGWVVCAVLWGAGCASEKQSVSVPVAAFDTTTMDRSVSPCADFDRFVNGKWQDTAQLPAGYASWGAFVKLSKDNELKINRIVKDLSSRIQKEGTDDQKIADLYRAYMDTAQLRTLGVQPIMPYVAKVRAIRNQEDYFRVIHELSPLLLAAMPYDWSIYPDGKNSVMNALYVGQSDLSIGDRDYYLKLTPENKAIQKAFTDYVTQLWVAFGYEQALAEEKAQRLLAFETDIAKIQISRVAQRDPEKTYNKVAFAALGERYPNIGVAKVLMTLGVNTDSVIVENLPFLAQLDKIYQGADALEQLKNYLEFQLINALADVLAPDIQDLQHRFYSGVLRGVRERKPLEQRAVAFVNRRLGELLGKKYAALYFPESSKKKVGEMIENVRSVYRERIEQNTWMSAATKQAAVEKLKAFTYKIGYPDKWQDYSSIKIEAQHLAESVLSVNKWHYQKTLNRLNKPVDKSEWYMTAQTVNAYYNGSGNEIVFPAGILQPPFFNPDADDAINYGGIMGVIGHEFTHGFDDQGSKINGAGNIYNWWGKEDRRRFEDRAQRLGKTYAGYKGLLSQGAINPKLTMGENIADLGGITLAYYALEKSLLDKEKPQKIDGFTYQQRFFLSWGRIWQSLSTVENEKRNLQIDPHSPPRARINVVLSNLKEFSEAWQCTEDKKTYTVIW